METNQLLIFVSGPPGCGKSTLSQGLARHFSLAYIDKDLIDEPFSPNDRGDHYTQEIEPKVLQSMINLAEKNLELGRSVILDAPWTHILVQTPSWIPVLSKFPRERPNVSVIWLECKIDSETLKTRIQTRGLKRDLGKLTPDGWQKFQTSDLPDTENPFLDDSHFKTKIIDMTKATEVCFETSKQFLMGHL